MHPFCSFVSYVNGKISSFWSWPISSRLLYEMSKWLKMWLARKQKQKIGNDKKLTQHGVVTFSHIYVVYMYVPSV